VRVITAMHSIHVRSRLKVYRSVAIAFSVCVLVTTSAYAAVIVDQSTGSSPVLGPGHALFVHSLATPSQTFTAGVSGALSSVDVGLTYFNDTGAPEPFQGVATILQGAAVLGSATFDSSGLNSDFPEPPLFKNVAFTGVHLAAGVVYRIELTAPSIVYKDRFAWERSLDDIYEGGSDSEGVGDLAFQTFMVVPDSVPSLSPLGMLLVGGLLAFAGWRRLRG
jgi:hypothetical protein